MIEVSDYVSRRLVPRKRLATLLGSTRNGHIVIAKEFVAVGV
jgi:hypothetical protein